MREEKNKKKQKIIIIIVTTAVAVAIVIACLLIGMRAHKPQASADAAKSSDSSSETTEIAMPDGTPTPEMTETADTNDAEAAKANTDNAETVQPSEPSTQSASIAPVQKTTTDAPAAPSQQVSYPLTYADSSMAITVNREWYQHAWCYVAHVTTSDYGRIGTVCANNSYGSSAKTSDTAHAIGAILAVNGDYAAPKLDYIVVRSGRLINGSGRACWLPAVYSRSTGLLQSAWETGGTPGIAGENIDTLVNNGTVSDSFSFGPPILVNGSVANASDSSRAQRTFIGTNGKPGDLYIVVSDGRSNDGESAGLTASECSQYLAGKGCTFGIPLDGGGSSTMVFQGTVLNAAKNDERSVVDCLYVK